MTWIFYLIIFVLFAFSVKYILDIDALEITNFLKSLRAHMEKAQNQTLQDVVDGYRGKKRGLVKQEYLTVKEILSETRQEKQLKSLIIKSAVLAIIGGIIGASVLKNPIAMPIVAFGFMMIPVWKLKLYQHKYNKYVSMQLESTLSLITTSYVRNNNIEKAIEENLEFIDSIIRPVFAEFLVEYRVNASVESCIKSMSKKIKNSIFQEWCMSLIKAYHNNALKEDLISITSKLSNVFVIQTELDTESAIILKQFIIMMVILVLAVPLTYILNYSWFLIFFTTLWGKLVLAYAIFVLIICTNKLVKFSMPVKYER